MDQFPEKPPTSAKKQEFTPEEVRKATTLDFVKLRDDRDYATLIYENPHVLEFMRDRTVFDLERIYEERKAIGLSEDQFQKLLAIFDQDVRDAFRKEIADGEIMRSVYKAADKVFSPAEIQEHSDETLAAMKREIELQEKNIPHEMVKLSYFPKKKHG